MKRGKLSEIQLKNGRISMKHFMPGNYMNYSSFMCICLAGSFRKIIILIGKVYSE